MNKVGSIAYLAAATAIVLLSAQDVKNGLLLFFDYSASPSMYALGIAGWCVATFGPLALSLYCWRLASRGRAKWAIHLLFIPCALVIVYGGELLLRYAAGFPHVEIPGRTLTLAFLLLALTALVHAGAFIAEIVARVRSQANVG